jgi:hypothetical protein
MPFHDIPLIAGVNSYFSPESQAMKSLRSAENMDTYSEFRTLGKVSGSTRIVDIGTSCESLHQFEFTDYDGTRKRHQLALDSDGELYRIDGVNSTTLLESGLVGAPLASCRSVNTLYLTSEEWQGDLLDTGGIAYDGNETRSWGVLAPGERKTTIFSFDDSGDWTPSGGTVADSSTSRDGSGSTSVAKTDTGVQSVSIVQSGLAVDLNDAGNSYNYFWLYIPPDAFSVLRNDIAAPAILIEIGDTTFANNDQHYVFYGDLLAGWNLIQLDLDNPDASGGAGATLSNIQKVQIWVFTNNNADTFSGVLFDWWYTTDREDCGIVGGGAGNLTGTYSYRFTYVTKNGLESNASDISNSQTVAAQEMEILTLPVSADPNVVARRIYRDNGGDQIFRYVDEVSDNTTTTYTDNVADASLGGETAPIRGDDQLDSSPPVPFSDCVSYNNRVFGIDASNPVILHISDVGLPEYFRLIDQLVLEEEMVALEVHSLGLLIHGRDRLLILTGDGVSYPFRVEELNVEVGTNSFRSTARAKGITVTVHENKVYQVVDPTDPWFISGPRHDVFSSMTAANVIALHDRARMRLLFAEAGSTTIHVYQYGTLGTQEISGDGPGTDPLDLRIGAWFTLSVPDAVNCMEIVERTSEEPELWVGCDDGGVYWLQDPSKTSWANGASTSAIAASFETHALPIGSPMALYPGAPPSAAGRGEPRFLLVHTEASVSSDWTVTVTLLDDADGDTVATDTFTLTLPSGQSSQIVPIPYIGARGSFVRLKFENSSTTQNGSFRAIRLYYLPRSRFRGEHS